MAIPLGPGPPKPTHPHEALSGVMPGTLVLPKGSLDEIRSCGGCGWEFVKGSLDGYVSSTVRCALCRNLSFELVQDRAALARYRPPVTGAARAKREWLALGRGLGAMVAGIALMALLTVLLVLAMWPVSWVIDQLLGY